MRAGFILLTFVLCGGIKTAHATDACESHLLPYLETLLEQGVLGLDEISDFAANLEQGRLTNPLTLSTTSTSTLVHRAQLDTLLAQVTDNNPLLQWSRQAMTSRLKDQQSRERVEQDTASTLLMTFVPVPGGPVRLSPEWYTKMDSLEGEVKDFLIASHPVTRGDWRHYMSPNLVGADDDDKPMNEVTWWAAAEYANRVSIAEGLPPFYKLEGIPWHWIGNAEDGTLNIAHGRMAKEAGDRAILASHDPMRSDGQGYRLPLSMEWYRVFILGTAHHLNIDPLKVADLNLDEIGFGMLAWNDQEQTVLEIEGRTVYNLLASHGQWISDAHEPQDATGFDRKRLLGGNKYNSHIQILLSGSFSAAPNSGFRLARSLP